MHLPVILALIGMLVTSLLCFAPAVLADSTTDLANLNNQIQQAYKQHDWQTADKLFEQTAAVFKRKGDTDSEVRTQMNRALMLNHAGLTEKAHNIIQTVRLDEQEPKLQKELLEAQAIINAQFELVRNQLTATQFSLNSRGSLYPKTLNTLPIRRQTIQNGSTGSTTESEIQAERQRQQQAIATMEENLKNGQKQGVSKWAGTSSGWAGSAIKH